MAMQMQRAFNARMFTKVVTYSQGAGQFNDLNVWTDGAVKEDYVYGIIKSGNKFSQFEEGIAVHNEEGGVRYSDFKTLYVTDSNMVSMKDKIYYKGSYYNVLQKSDEEEFGFASFLLEKSENWSNA
tara:strand:- start:4358 stop:4735 length:378 start_codon:yes stop_codon:yes gene_type:complete